MKAHIISILTLTIISSRGGSISELSNDALFEAFNGRQVEGYSAEALHAELGGREAARLVEKCIEDERLRKSLVVFPEHITDPALKDKVMEYILEEPGVWLADEDPESISQAPSMQARYFANNGLRETFLLEEGSPELPELSKALLKKSTRLLIANLYHDVSGLAADERKKDSREMKAAVEDLRQILAGATPSKLASRKEAQSNSAISSSNPPSSPSAGQSETGHAVGRSVAWISAALVLLLGIAGFFAFRRKAA
ncbi:hypothetical protein [Haloferula sp. BvORR071]|uniref:hypothetical protein n=1 Tax=Haloferula sp. BvORR071 TaxID=1396141 RepID=UPI000557FEBF|nr:hypothetical protein [Haloferula sp. BvORR071]